MVLPGGESVDGRVLAQQFRNRNEADEEEGRTLRFSARESPRRGTRRRTASDERRVFCDGCFLMRGILDFRSRERFLCVEFNSDFGYAKYTTCSLSLALSSSHTLNRLSF